MNADRDRLGYDDDGPLFPVEDLGQDETQGVIEARLYRAVQTRLDDYEQDLFYGQPAAGRVYAVPGDAPQPPRWHRWAWAALAVAVLAAVVALVTSWAVTR